MKRGVGISNRTFITMHPLEVHYLYQAGRCLTPGIGAVSSGPHCIQRGQGIGNFFDSLFPWVRPILLSEAKAVGLETLRTVDKILSHIAEHKSTEVSPEHIVSKQVTEYAQNLISKLPSRGRKRFLYACNTDSTRF